LDIENTSRYAITGRFSVEGHFARCFCQVSVNALLALCVRKLSGRRACAVRIHLDAVMQKFAVRVFPARSEILRQRV
jgi:hypothetical protein